VGDARAKKGEAGVTTKTWTAEQLKAQDICCKRALRAVAKDFPTGENPESVLLGYLLGRLYASYGPLGYRKFCAALGDMFDARPTIGDEARNALATDGEITIELPDELQGEISGREGLQ
jgi:hypothetical protein